MLFPKPAPLAEGFYDDTSFLKNPREYNNLFAFSALGVTGGFQGPPGGSGTSMVKIQGKVYHRIFDLSWQNGKTSNNSELYIDDGAMRAEAGKKRNLNTKIISSIQAFLNRVNPLCSVYKVLGSHPSETAHIVFEKTSRANDGPVLGDRPASQEISAIIKTDAAAGNPRKASVWKINEREPQFIDILDPIYEPLQFPIVFPTASAGWHVDMTGPAKDETKDGTKDETKKGRKLSQTKYYRQWMLCGDDRMRKLGRLGQEVYVDGFSRIEEEKLNYIRHNQDLLTRKASRKELDETIAGEGGVKVGRIYLPSSFTGSPRNLQLKYQDAMAVVARRGKPSFFVTSTCNPGWKEIKENLLPHQSASDRPDLCDRVFHEKLAIALKMIKDGTLFGKMITLSHVIEFQKRGLPHAHIALRVVGGGPVRPEDIDRVIRATIPDENEADGRLRRLVLEHMVHGPCGNENPNSRCMQEDKDGKKKCSKDYPKPFCDTTFVDERGYVHYRRPEGPTAVKETRYGNYYVDNRDIVPYCPALLLLLECHCNVEISSTVQVIKYLFKYINKGPDMAKVAITDDDEPVDECSNFESNRIVGVSEALYRIFEYNMSSQYPPVKALPVHLPNEDTIIFQEGKEKEALENSVSKLMLYMNRPRHPDLDGITYLEFYEKFSISTKKPTSKSRTVFELHTGRHYCAARVGEDAVARIHWISPANTELYYLRMLLSRFPANGYEDLLSYNGERYSTFQEAAKARGLVDDENEYSDAIREASTFQTGHGLRQLLVCLITSSGAPAKVLWDEFKELFAEDLIDSMQDKDKAINAALNCIDRKLQMHGKNLEEVGLPKAIDDSTEVGRERVRWNTVKLEAFVKHWLPLLTSEQMAVFNYVIEGLEKGIVRNPAFVDGPSGTGKTLLLQLIAAQARVLHKIVLCVSSTGISALNYDGGITAHAMLKIPIETNDPNAYCNLSSGSQRAELIKAADLIIWDEAPMSHKHNIETVDRTLQDLISPTLFGGKPMVKGGDYKQIPPVVQGGTKADILRISLKFSPIWKDMQVFHLTSPQRDREDAEYSEFVKAIGEDRIDRITIDENGEQKELVPLTLVQTVNTVDELIEFVYDDVCNEAVCARRAILSGTNDNIDSLNELVLDRLNGDTIELLSADTCAMDETDPENRFAPTEVLHTFGAPGVPHHRLIIKPGCICILLRNMSFDDGLVNGAKVVIRRATNRMIEADLLREGFSPKKVSIPRILFKFQPVRSSITVLRRQFPLRLAYSLTFNKSQGQTLEKIGLDLRSDVFAHGQLYVALGRVRNRESIRVLVPPERVINGRAAVKNIVYPELL